MADFCLKCFNKYVADKHYTEDDVIMQYDICEGCKQNLPCVIYVKTEEQKEYERIKDSELYD